jgi:hypothetical protein
MQEEIEITINNISNFKIILKVFNSFLALDENKLNKLFLFYRCMCVLAFN